MSDPVRIALVAEGPTDKIVIEAAIRGILGDTPFIIQQLQPEQSQVFLDPAIGTGWGGVYRWCRKAVERASGLIEQDILFATYRMLILHLDAEVAAESYGNAGIIDSENDLPFAEPCPPASATTDQLRLILLRWIGRATLPARTVLCTPSKNTEAWVLCALYPKDGIVTAGGVECFGSPENRLNAKPQDGKVIRSGKKHSEAYKKRAHEISGAWNRLRNLCSEAERFSRDFESFIQAENAGQV